MDWERFWDILAWIGFGITVMYFFLKAFGVLNSPLSADVITIIGASIFFGRHIQKVEHISKDVNKIDNRLCVVEDKLDITNSRLNLLENRLNLIDTRLINVEKIVKV